jgi:hypothetical protein
MDIAGAPSSKCCDAAAQVAAGRHMSKIDNSIDRD